MGDSFTSFVAAAHRTNPRLQHHSVRLRGHLKDSYAPTALHTARVMDKKLR